RVMRNARHRAANAALGVVACAIFALLPASPAAATECRVSTVNDYAAPLAALPPVTPLVNGRMRLPFGPRGVVLGYRSFGDLLIPGTEGGPGLSLVTGSKIKRALHPGWRVASKLVQVSAAGDVERVVDTRRARVEKLAPRTPVRLGLYLPQLSPGFY